MLNPLVALRYSSNQFDHPTAIMLFSISDMTRRDETDEKIPTKGKGLGAFLSPSGFTTIVLVPFTIWHTTRENKKTVKALREARQEEAERIDDERWEEDERQKEMRDKLDADRDGLGPQGPSREKKVPEVEPIALKLERDPENPRVCDPKCPSYGMENCVVHNRKPSSRPTSPGLLAI
jgi:hypothetical protein